MLMSAADYKDSLRAYRPRVFLDGEVVTSVADELRFAPGIAAIGLTYDTAHDVQYRPLATAGDVNRLLHINRGSQDLINKLELVRLLCRECGCAQRYLTQDGLNALHQATFETDAEEESDYHPRFLAYLTEVQAEDLTLGIAMTDAKGDRLTRPHLQDRRDSYLHIRERRGDGIVIRGVKSIVTAAPYVHGFLVLPGRNMTAEDADFALACAVPVDAPGVTIIARPEGRPGEAAAKFSARYGQSTGVVVFDDVFVPWERVFLAGEWAQARKLTAAYATHHRHSCIAARAGFGDLLIGAGVLMAEANGLDPERVGHVRESLVQLIKTVEGFFACGVAASLYGFADASG